MLHHAIDYTPYEGMTFENWPRYTILRGKIVWDRDLEFKRVVGGAGSSGVSFGGLLGKKSDGMYIKRGTSSLPGARGVFVNEWRPPM